jgi:hypothetical protein
LQGRYIDRKRHITMPRVGFEPSIPVFERPDTFYALDRAATVIGAIHFMIYNVWSDNNICLNAFRSFIAFLKFLTHTQ